MRERERDVRESKSKEIEGWKCFLFRVACEI